MGSGPTFAGLASLRDLSVTDGLLANFSPFTSFFDHFGQFCTWRKNCFHDALTQSNSSLRPVSPSSALSQPSLFKASTSSPTLTLPLHLHGRRSYHRDKLGRSPDMQPLVFSLAPPAALPSTILHLLINLDARTLPLTRSPPEKQSLLSGEQSFRRPSASAQGDPIFFCQPSPHFRITALSEEAAIELKSVEAEHPQPKSKVCNSLACSTSVLFVRPPGIKCDYDGMTTNLLGPSLGDVRCLCDLVPTDRPPSSSDIPFPSLHQVQLMASTTSTILHPSQRLKTRFIAIRGSSGRCLFISVLVIAPNPTWYSKYPSTLKEFESVVWRYFEGSGLYPAHYTLPAASSSPFAHPELSAGGILTAIPLFGPGVPPPSPSTASAPDKSRQTSLDSHPSQLEPPQLPTPPATHLNIPSPANSMSLVTPSDHAGDTAKTVSSTGLNATQTPGNNISPPYHLAHMRKSSSPITAHPTKSHNPIGTKRPHSRGPLACHPDQIQHQSSTSTPAPALLVIPLKTAFSLTDQLVCN